MGNYAVAFKKENNKIVGKRWMMYLDVDDEKIVADENVSGEEGDTTTAKTNVFTKKEGWGWKTFDTINSCDIFYSGLVV